MSLDKTNRGFIQLLYHHQFYVENRDKEGFMGFSQEYVTGWGTGPSSAIPHVASCVSNTIENRTYEFDNNPTNRLEEKVTKRPKLAKQFIEAENMGETDYNTDQQARLITTENDTVEITKSSFNLRELEEMEADQGGPYFFCQEVNYPDLQDQTIDGMAGAQLTLKKIEILFSKRDHGVEFVDIDLHSLVPMSGESLQVSIHNGATRNVIRCLSDGESMREIHPYDTYIGKATGDLIKMGIHGVGFYPRLGQRCFGMRPGNDTLYQTYGVEKDATSGTVNGHVIRVSIILERLS
jgi:hypothetical protein